MKKIKLAAAMLLFSVLVACEEPDTPAMTESEPAPESLASSDASKAPEPSKAELFCKEHFLSNGEAELLNFRKPVDGEEIAVIKTNFGEIKLLLFPEAAPLAVSNFKQLATSGSYNGLTFDRVATDMLIQSGDPTGTGDGGQSFLGEPFANECTERALHLRGAIGMVNSGTEKNQGQFFIVQAPPATIDSDLWEMLEEKKEMAFPKLVRGHYEKQGGLPWLDFNSTVFGQVYEGLDIVDSISQTEVDDNLKPLTDASVETVTIEQAVVLPQDVSSETEN